MKPYTLRSWVKLKPEKDQNSSSLKSRLENMEKRDCWNSSQRLSLCCGTIRGWFEAAAHRSLLLDASIPPKCFFNPCIADQMEYSAVVLCNKKKEVTFHF
ncbi:hypothetical protein MA16_Dca014727 [Dendrobium catenatum]|uniref:Uncharacterized protein n=1 Tax=Dendrobium catenatum TaxID=906689 RepID=A0A2I0VIM5_9ASPA|nr:hypothetical protein MA16_Dca014727 [Dendrobium catenatum]